MTANASTFRSTDRDRRIPSHAARDTHPLSAEHPLAIDAYDVLDHRTRQGAVPAEVALPGRSLAVEHEGRNRLISLRRPITQSAAV